MFAFSKRLLLMYRPFWWHMAVVFMFIAAQQALSLAEPYVYGRLFDLVVIQAPIASVYAMLCVGIGLYLLRSCFVTTWRDRYEIKHLDFEILMHASRETLNRMLLFSIGQHMREHSGLKQSKIARGQHAVGQLGKLVLYNILPALVEVLFLVGMLCYFSVPIGLVLFTGSALFLGVTHHINRKLFPELKTFENMHHDDSRLQADLLANIDLVLTNSQEDRVKRECDESQQKVYGFAYAAWTRHVNRVMWRQTIMGATKAGVTALGVYLVYRGTCTPGQLMMFLSWSGSALGRVEQAGHLQRQIMSLVAMATSYFRFVDTESEIHEIPNPVCPDSIRGQIEFRNVTHSYEFRRGTDKKNKRETGVSPEPTPVLRQVNFTIKSGQTVALVGESGAGKTSIVRALVRAFDPSEGQIFIDGQDLRVLDLKRYREAVGVVQQDVPTLDATLKYNITFGLNGRRGPVTDAEFEGVIRASRLTTLMPRLEHGYETFVGERGVQLSGGERQRVGIARAIIKDPAILIFDEATSNLDAESERIIQQSIRELARNRTTIIIAHRLSTIRWAHKIIVMDKGSIVGEGSHKHLMETCPRYRSLVETQLRPVD